MGGIGLAPAPCSTLEYQRRKTKFLVIHVEQEAQQGSTDLGTDTLQFSPCVIYEVLFGSIFRPFGSRMQNVSEMSGAT